MPAFLSYLKDRMLVELDVAKLSSTQALQMMMLISWVLQRTYHHQMEQTASTQLDHIHHRVPFSLMSISVLSLEIDHICTLPVSRPGCCVEWFPQEPISQSRQRC